MSDCKLFKGKSGKLYFGTRRFDRVAKERLHLHSAAGLMHDNFRASTMDYGNLMNAKGEWQLAPAYDLTFSNTSYGFHSTMVAGESQNPNEQHLLKLANHFGLRDGAKIIEEVRTAVAEWRHIAREYDIRPDTIKKIRDRINSIGKTY